MATIGELIINLRASTAAFSKDLDKAKNLAFSTSQEISRSLSRIGTVVATELTAASAAVSALVSKSIDMAESIALGAQKAGLSTETFSVYSYAAKKVGLDTDTLSRSLVLMAKNLEKSNLATLEGKAAHGALSTLFSGNVPIFRNTSDAFEQITKKLAAMPDGYQKSALAAQIFGKAGANLIPLINENADGFTRAGIEAQKYGVIISQEAGANAIKFQESLRGISAVVEGLGLRLASELLPYMQNLADKLLEFSNDASRSQATITGLASSVKVLASGVVLAGGAFAVAGNAAAAFWIASNPEILIAKWGMQGYWAALKSSLSQVGDAYKSTANIIQEIWTPAVQKSAWSLSEMFAIGEAAMKRIYPAGPLQAPGKADDKSGKIFEKLIEKINEEQIAFISGADAAERYRLRLEGLNATQIRVVQSKEQQLTAMKAFQDLQTQGVEINGQLDLSSYKYLDEVTSMLHDTLSQQDLWNMKLDRTLFLFKEGAIDATELNTVLKQQNDVWEQINKKQDTTKQLGNELASGLKSLFVTAIFHAKSFKDALGSVLERLAEMVVQIAILDPIIAGLKSSLSGAGGGGGLLSGIGSFIGGLFKADGGAVNSGQPYIVGEKGPEWFVPSSSGTIIPNGAGGAAIVNNYNIDARGADAGAEERIRAALRDTENRSVQRSVVAMRELQLRSV